MNDDTNILIVCFIYQYIPINMMVVNIAFNIPFHVRESIDYL